MRLHQRVTGTLVILATLTALAVPAKAEDHSIRQMLAARLTRNARVLVGMQTLTLEAMEMGIVLLQESLELDPESVGTWHLLMDLATHCERDDLRAEALDKLSELEPDNDVITLMRVNAAIDRLQTFDERVTAYERLLSEANRQKLGPAVTSRLALDLALLCRRHGDLEAFAHWLAESVALDPAYPTAVATAAGYYRANVDDAYGQAELLKAVVLANPADMETQAALAQLLLENAAYAAAERMYQMAAQTQWAAGSSPSNDLLADLAIAQWGQGDTKTALRTIHNRQRKADQEFRTAITANINLLPQLAQADPMIRETIVGWWGSSILDQQDEIIPEEVVSKLQLKRGLTTHELSQFHGTISPTLAAVRAAIHVATGDERAVESLQRTIQAYETTIRGWEERPEANPAESARLHLGLAWVMIWLGADPEAADDHLLAAEQAQPLNEMARDRFAGWIALREGSLEEAEDLLSRHAEVDAACALGLAQLRFRQDRPSDAARQYLSVAQANPGTLMGVWAAHRLAALLGRWVQVHQEARRLDELIDSIPSIVDQFGNDASLALRLKVVPSDLRLTPYEPFLVNIEITNTSPIPLALNRGGPLRLKVLMLPKIKVAGSSTADPLAQLDRLDWWEAIVVNVGRRLKLEPRERLTIPIDLQSWKLGGRLDMYPLEGALISLRAITNFRSTTPPMLAEEMTTVRDASVRFSAGALGMETESPLIRVNGVSLTPAWLDDSLAAIAEPDCLEDVKLMALLARWLETGWRQPVTPVVRQRMDEVAAALAVAFPKLDTIEQAWLMCVIPHAPHQLPAELSSTIAIQDMARQSEHRLVQLTNLWFHNEGPADPALEAALRSEHETVSAVARLLQEMYGRAAETSDQSGTGASGGQGR